MTRDELLKFMRRRVASTSIGPSTVRKLIPKGTIDKVRKYLFRPDLSVFSTHDVQKFASILDTQTERFRRGGLGRHRKMRWGVARKCLNIYLRNAAYQYALRDHYQLERIEAFLEVPLDSHVAYNMCEKEPEASELSGFKSVKRLDAQTNHHYQVAASVVARRLGIARVHLDLKYWHSRMTKKKRSRKKGLKRLSKHR